MTPWEFGGNNYSNLSSEPRDLRVLQAGGCDGLKPAAGDVGPRRLSSK